MEVSSVQVSVLLYLLSENEVDVIEVVVVLLLPLPLLLLLLLPCWVGSVGSVSASRMVGREFASQPGHTKDHHKNGTNCLPA